jgi:hypothetical protein
MDHDRISNFLKEFGRKYGLDGSYGFQTLYSSLRHSEKPYPQGDSTGLSEYFDNGNPKMYATNQNGWIWCYQKDLYKSGGVNYAIADRLSLNVYPSRQMLETLDKIILEDNGEFVSYYKTSDNVQSWNRRHDPITIYMHNADSVKKKAFILKLAGKIAPFVRVGKILESSAKVGMTVATGISYEAEPNGETVAQIYTQAKKFPEFIEYLNRMLIGSNAKYKNGAPIMSAGHFWLASNALKEYIGKYCDKTATLNNARAKIQEIAKIVDMDRSTGTDKKCRYFIPNNAKDMPKLALQLQDMDIKTKLHYSKLHRRQVLIQEI